jgi:hypothetical protein
LPINIHILTLQLSQQFSNDKEELQGRINQIIELDETKRMTFDQMEKNQRKIKGTFDHKERQRHFKKGYLVLMWDKRRDKPQMHQKFDSLWLGPYKIKEKSGFDSLYFSTNKGRKMSLPVNGSLLKLYFQKEPNFFRAQALGK